MYCSSVQGDSWQPQEQSALCMANLSKQVSHLLCMADRCRYLSRNAGIWRPPARREPNTGEEPYPVCHHVFQSLFFPVLHFSFLYFFPFSLLAVLPIFPLNLTFLFPSLNFSYWFDPFFPSVGLTFTLFLFLDPFLIF